MRTLVILGAIGLLALPATAQTHQSRFELSEEFVLAWSDAPVRDVAARLDCAGPVHNPASDCEVHIGAEFVDSSFTDFPNVVLEPPNLCKSPRTPTRANLNALHDEECVANGFLRAWPEHLTSGSGCSNPDHFLEVHPMIKLTCGATHFDFTPKLRAFDDLGFKSPQIVNRMMDMQFWVCRGCSADPSMLSFDYCFGDPCKAGQASNFGRFEDVVILRDTIRPAANESLDDVATVIAQVTPKDSDSPRQRPLKLYAVKGSAFYDMLLAERGQPGDAPSIEILGIFTFDPFSIKRALEKNPAEGEWTPVPHPVSLIVFGTL